MEEDARGEKIYVEYSNEVWNGIFRQTKYTQEQGVALGLDPSPYKAGMKFYNKRSTEVVKIWKQVFSPEADRLVNVWAWQTGYQDYTKQALDDLGSEISTFDALAITGYFSCDQAAYKQNHSVKLLMYEGGPGMETSRSHDDTVTSHAIDFHRHVLMETAVTDTLEAWHSVVNSDPYNTVPGGLFNYFSSVSAYSKYGSWGLLEYTGQDPNTSPKYMALQKLTFAEYYRQLASPRVTFRQPEADS